MSSALSSSLLGGIGFGAVVAGLKSFGNEMDDMADAASRFNTVPETFQRVAEAAKVLGGTDIDTVGRALERLRRQLEEDPSDKLSQALSNLGINGADFAKLDMDQQLLSLADAYTKAADDGVALSSLNALLGKSFGELLPLLQQGSPALKEYMDAVKVISDADVQRIANLNDQFDTMAHNLGTTLKQAAIDLMSVFGQLKDVMDSVFNRGVVQIGPQKYRDASFMENLKDLSDKRSAANLAPSTLKDAALKKRMAESVAAEANRPGGDNLFTRFLGGVSSFLGTNAAPFKSALAAKLNDEASKSASNTTSLARAAFSPLRGDADISTGRGRSVNPLVQNASKQIAEMTKQTNLLKRQADSLSDSNKYLGSIEKLMSNLKLSTTYN